MNSCLAGIPWKTMTILRRFIIGRLDWKMVMRKKHVISRALVVMALVVLFSAPGGAAEVEKGAIPDAHLDKSQKALQWGVGIWDVDEAIEALKTNQDTLWVDTRPESLYNKGTIAGAVLLPYNKTGKSGNVLSQQTLDKALADNGLGKDTAKVVFFCQGPKCHRSYNATFVAVSQWGYKPENIIWFRDGYPALFNAVKSDPKLKRKAKRYLDANARKQL